MKNKDVTLLINSCDAYRDILDAFFESLHKFWPDMSYDIVLSTESLEYTNQYFKIKNVHPKTSNCSWSRRMYETLGSIKSDYVLFMLDDFFLYDYVNNNEILKCVDYLKRDNCIVNFTFWPRLVGWKKTKLDGYVLRNQNVKYKVAAIAGLWNKKQFAKYLENVDEDIWEFEVNGTIRSNTIYKLDKFYCTDLGNVVIPYDFSKYGLISGKWFKDTVELFKKININMDFSKRGFFDEALIGRNRSFISSFRIEPYVIPNKSFEKINKEIYLDKAIPAGEFNFKLRINGARDIIRLVLAEQRGFGVRDLKIKFIYKNNEIRYVDNNNLFGNYLVMNDVYVFNCGPAVINVPIPYNKKIREIEVEGNSICPLEEDCLKLAYNKRTESSNKLDEQLALLLDIDRNVNFLNVQHMTIKPCMDGRKYDSIEKIANKYKFKFKINNFSEHIEKLVISKDIYYSISDLMIKNDNGEICKVEGLPAECDGQYVFLSPMDINVFIPQNSRKLIVEFKLKKPSDKKIIARLFGIDKEIFKKIRGNENE